MNRLVYPTNNKVLRLIGDILLTFGSWLITKGEKWGGLYEWEIDMEEDEEDDV